MDDSLIILAVAIIIVGIILFVIIHFMPRTDTIDKEKYQSRWLEIEQKLQLGNPDSQAMSILKADKLLDQALKETGSKGATMGERMKNRQNAWSNANTVWAAHKLRNKVAHDDNVVLSDQVVVRALASFKQALKDLGVM